MKEKYIRVTLIKISNINFYKNSGNSCEVLPIQSVANPDNIS